MPQTRPLKLVEVAVIQPGVLEEVRLIGKYSVPPGLLFESQDKFIVLVLVKVAVRFTGMLASVNLLTLLVVELFPAVSLT